MSTVTSPVAAVKAGVAVAATAAVAGTALVKLVLDRPSRTYSTDSVAREYDAWAHDGILEYYWGEHIHLGYYSKEELDAGYKKKDFIQAKYDFVDEMLNWSGSQDPATVLDVGCGIGGTSRYLAAKFPKADVTGALWVGANTHTAAAAAAAGATA